MTEKIPQPDGTWIYPVPGMIGTYVTADGKVFGTEPGSEELKPLKQYTQGRRYAAVWIPGTGLQSVHQLVCRTFHGEPPSTRHVVARNNGDATDNSPENLRWDTRWNAGKVAFHRRNPPKEKQPRR